MSCHADNKLQGWCTSLAFLAISQLHFYNNSVSYFPGGLWPTVPEKITGSLLLSKMKGVGLSPAKCGGAVEEGKQLSWRHPVKPLVSGEVGEAQECWAQAGGGWALVPSSRDMGLAIDNTGGWAQPCHQPGWGRAGACHGAGWLDAIKSWRGKNGSFVFSAQWLNFMASLCYSCSIGYEQIKDDNLYPKANWLWYGVIPFCFA